MTIYAKIDGFPTIFKDESGKSISKLIAQNSLPFPTYKTSIVTRTKDKARIRICLKDNPDVGMYMNLSNDISKI